MYTYNARSDIFKPGTKYEIEICIRHKNKKYYKLIFNFYLKFISYYYLVQYKF